MTVEIGNAHIFLEYADKNIERWQLLVGQIVRHVEDGEGRVIGITQGSHGPRLEVAFKNESAEFASSFFGQVFIIDTLPTSLEGENLRHRYEAMALERERQRQIELKERAKEEEKRAEEERKVKRMEADRKHFDHLREKFRITSSAHDDPISPLYAILLKIEEKRSLDPKDLAWLEEQKLFRFLGDYYKWEYKRSGDLWMIVKASKLYRRTYLPKEAIKISEGVRSRDKKVYAAILTTRGGAFRDLKQYDEAKRCAADAISLQPDSYFAYNLLGAVQMQIGEAVDGERTFERAVKLGADPRLQDREIQRSVKESRLKEDQRRTAAYLLRKDPVRYSWAKKYLEEK